VVVEPPVPLDVEVEPPVPLDVEVELPLLPSPNIATSLVHAQRPSATLAIENQVKDFIEPLYHLGGRSNAHNLLVQFRAHQGTEEPSPAARCATCASGAGGASLRP